MTPNELALMAQIVALENKLAELAKQEPVAIAEGRELLWIASKRPADDETDMYLFAAPVIPAGWLTEERAEHINALCEAAAPKPEDTP